MRNGKSAEQVSGLTEPAVGHLPPAEQKAVYVRDMFGRIAWRYDLMNRLMTFGRDRTWRRYTVSQLGLEAPHAGNEAQAPGSGLVLDVATGTGDLAFETLAQRPDAHVVGLDFVPEMLILAQQKAMRGNDQTAYPLEEATQRAAGSFALLAGDALRIPFPNGAFDAIVTGFALRNVTDIPAAFAEMARVTRRGGRVACLEIAKPQTLFFRRLFALYFYRLVPLLGGWITGQRSAYHYLPHSLSAFLNPDEIADVMRQTGWREVSYKRLMLGTVAVHVGVRG
jgi:demethylmenaquinone methyltransferase/2-methoxy-6-polyprenyl-1,4-benzoquinol methylase